MVGKCWERWTEVGSGGKGLGGEGRGGKRWGNVGRGGQRWGEVWSIWRVEEEYNIND